MSILESTTKHARSYTTEQIVHNNVNTKVSTSANTVTNAQAQTSSLTTSTNTSSTHGNISGFEHILSNIFSEDILRTQQQELEQLKLLITHESRNNDDTIFKPTLHNGSFINNVLIRECDDTFVNFKCKVELLKPVNGKYSLKQFWTIYSKYNQTHNVIIDSRMIAHIAYATMKYEDVLIYDVCMNCVKTVHAFCTDFFQLQSCKLAFMHVKLLLICYTILCVNTSDFKFNWDSNVLLDCINMYRYNVNVLHNPNSNIFDILINYIRIQNQTSANISNIMRVVHLFVDSFSSDAFTVDTNACIQKWNANNKEEINKYEFYIALTILRNMNYNFI